MMHLQLGEISTVVVSSPETAKEFLKTHDINFASRPTIMAAEINCYGSTDIALAKYGEYWRQLRKICTLELLTASRVQSFRSIREEEGLEMCRWIAGHDGGSEINLSDRLAMVNLNVMARAAFGRKNGEVAAELMRVIKEAQNILTVFNIVDVYPSRKFLRLFSRMKRMIEKHHVILHRITEDIIQQRKTEIAANGGFDNDEQDLLDVLLKFQADPSLEIPLTTDNIKSVLLDGAGVDSSTTTVIWAFAEMLKSPGVLKRAQEEVRKVFHGKNRVDECFFDELKYMKLVIKETLRLHPPGPLLLPRESREPCQINGYDIPARVGSWLTRGQLEETPLIGRMQTPSNQKGLSKKQLILQQVALNTSLLEVEEGSALEYHLE